MIPERDTSAAFFIFFFRNYISPDKVS